MSYTITYTPGMSAEGQPGFDYVVTRRGRFVSQGWTPGKRHHAEREARADIQRYERRAA